MKSKKKRNLLLLHLIELGALVLVVLFVNIISSYIFTRFDLTEEKRYTLSDSTKDLLKSIDEPILFRVYLDGDDLPAEYRRFRNEIKDMLDQFRAYNKNVEYEFTNPNDMTDKNELMQFDMKLASKGVGAKKIVSGDDNLLKQQNVYPIVEVSYRGSDVALDLQAGSATERVSEANVVNEDAITASIENLEYNFVTAIRRLTRVMKPRVGFLLGHGELDRIDIFDIQMALVEDYAVENVLLDQNINALTGRILSPDSTIKIANKFDVLVVPKPIEPFSDMDLYILDQYVMYGGKILWLVDALDADMDSLQYKSETFSTRLPLGLDEMFFNYGVRINSDLIMDYRCRKIPIVVSDNSKIYPSWYYFPTLKSNSDHPIVKNLDEVKTDFISSIDLINNDIDKTVLLTTSDHVHIKNAPAHVQLDDITIPLNDQLFNRSNLPVAVLLEGEFQSMWRNRLANSFTSIAEMGYKDRCDKPTQMIVVSDGDIIRNDIGSTEDGIFPLPLGYDKYIDVMFANRTFVLNAVNYLAGDKYLIDARHRDITTRRLDAVKVKKQRVVYQLATTVVPIVSVLLLAALVFAWRHFRYSRSVNKNKKRK